MPMYPEIMVVPMREELTRLGIEELRTAEEVDRALKNRPGTTMVVVNSICGCAAGRMRPAVRVALQNSIRPDHAYSVFAGQETEATDRARSYFTGYPPSSPIDRDSTRRRSRLHDAAPRHRITRSAGDCRRPEGGTRQAVREARDCIAPLSLPFREAKRRGIWCQPAPASSRFLALFGMTKYLLGCSK